MNFPNAIDWRASQRADGSIFLTCGGSLGDPLFSVDVVTDDLELAQYMAAALNHYGIRDITGNA